MVIWEGLGLRVKGLKQRLALSSRSACGGKGPSARPLGGCAGLFGHVEPHDDPPCAMVEGSMGLLGCSPDGILMASVGGVGGLQNFSELPNFAQGFQIPRIVLSQLLGQVAQKRAKKGQK